MVAAVGGGILSFAGLTLSNDVVSDNQAVADAGPARTDSRVGP